MTLTIVDNRIMFLILVFKWFTPMHYRILFGVCFDSCIVHCHVVIPHCTIEFTIVLSIVLISRLPLHLLLLLFYQMYTMLTFFLHLFLPLFYPFYNRLIYLNNCFNHCLIVCKHSSNFFNLVNTFLIQNIMTANTLSSTCFDKIFKDLDQKKIWTSDLLFNLNDKLETDPEFVNLSDILKSRNNFAFPSHFNGAENKSKLIIALRLSAMKCGFWLVLGTSKSQKELNKHHLAYLTLSCQQSVTFHRSRSITNKRNCQTSLLNSFF